LPIEKWFCLLRRIAFVSSITALAMLAWLPAHAMTRTTLGGHAEHLIAYVATTIVMGLAFSGSPRLAVQGVLLIGYAAILEVGQLHAAGRHASFDDFAFSAAGVAIGGVCLWIARARLRRPASHVRLRNRTLTSEL
jgi:VanZ family protein